MSKLPAIQFYPSDWRNDNGVQSLNFTERGIWFEMLCLMHESEQRGKLLLNGKPMPEEALARLLGLDRQVLSKTLAVLLDFGVCDRDENGALMNRRMVRDEADRQANADRQRKFYSKNKGGKQPNAEPNANLTEIQQKSNNPSSSSSSNKKDTNVSTKDAASAAAVREVFEEWKTVLNHPKAQLDEKRRKRIKARLSEGFSADDLKRVCHGVKLSPYHMGQNANSTIFDEIDTIFRDRAQVEKFLALAKPNIPPEMSDMAAMYLKAEAEWREGLARPGVRNGTA